jgi:hypothetical protein
MTPDKEKPEDDVDGPGDLSRFSGSEDSVTPLGGVVRRTTADPEALKAQKEARRILDEARKAE